MVFEKFARIGVAHACSDDRLGGAARDGIEATVGERLADVLKKDGRREEFKPDKLLVGFKQACWKRQINDDVIDQMVSNVINRISEETNSQGEIPSKKIGEFAMEELKKVDEVAYVRFASVYRHFKDAEAFINEIHKLPSQSNDTEGGE